ncbi:Integral membrane protein [Streptomyces ambofaciens ATCC 23877]|uniref:Integral membrane protein n=1 Tax=Streptomyces ambofaciens (strain ATCC 23877 / 3486 / DSM 40053 / JCM 4204 / NBRC 12836 / NRRL B-2516) TaxID=278992 RepID=A0A0K2ARP2_STRA7|nr:ComEC/Rec2 family competence protein [Streptomyces ambofaciens]AKZ55663.1 Integral membrane protein [Streptomyces ambofaciens ATCC 23877]
MSTDVTAPGRAAEPGERTAPPRAAVHAASGHRLGAAHPRQEGPTDLRLVPPALGTWATAAVMLDAPPGWTVGVVTGGLLLAGVLLLRARGRRPARGRRHVSFVALLLCVAAAAASAALHGADLRRGPVPALARQYATVTAEVEVTADPRLTRPRVRGNRAVPPTVLIEGDVRRLTEAGGAEVVTRTPVLMLVDVGGAAGGFGAPGASGGPETSGGTSSRLSPGAPNERPLTGAGPGAAHWLGLLPTTRLRVTARSAPPRSAGDRIAAVLRVRGGREAPEVVAEPSGAQRLAGRLRAGLREATDGLPEDARALLPGLVVGDTSRITPELEEAFKETDLAHTLAVSGANFTIVLALLLGPPGLAQRSERRGLAPRLGISLRTTALLGGVLALGFVVVCRPDPSVLRAAACGAVALLALATGRRRSLLPALATAVLLLVLYDPWLARSYGFLLSVLATGALLTLAPRWSAALCRRRVPPRLAEALAAAGAAQALCAPVVAVLSARVSLVAVPCNLLVEFAVAPATVLGFAALAAAPVAMPVAEGLAWCGSWPAEWIAGIARTGAALPGAGVDWPGSWTGAALLALATVGVLLAGRRLLGHPWWCGLCAALLVLVVVRPPPLARVITGWPPPDWRMVMCDVGQGDAMVLAAGEGTGVVVDTGPDPALVDHCLRSLGVTRVPLVVLTHFHADHVAGLAGVLRGRAVGAIETTALEEPADQAESVRRQAAARRIPLRHAAAGQQRRAGPLSWQVVWPPPPSAASTGAGPATSTVEPNDASVTLLVRTAGLRLLLLGDLEPPAQQELAKSPAAGALEGVDVLKVAHHGSAHQDPGLLGKVAPRLALISCGADNTYGHPAPATVAALRARGTMVLRTDRDGALAVTGTGEALRVAGD